MLTGLVILAETLEQIGRTPREAAAAIERCCQDLGYLAGVSGLIADHMRKVDGTISVIYPLPELKLGVQSVARDSSAPSPAASSLSSSTTPTTALRMLTVSSSAQAKT